MHDQLRLELNRLWSLHGSRELLLHIAGERRCFWHRKTCRDSRLFLFHQSSGFCNCLSHIEASGLLLADRERLDLLRKLRVDHGTHIARGITVLGACLLQSRYNLRIHENLRDAALVQQQSHRREHWATLSIGNPALLHHRVHVGWTCCWLSKSFSGAHSSEHLRELAVLERLFAIREYFPKCDCECPDLRGSPMRQ